MVSATLQLLYDEARVERVEAWRDYLEAKRGRLTCELLDNGVTVKRRQPPRSGDIRRAMDRVLAADDRYHELFRQLEVSGGRG